MSSARLPGKVLLPIGGMPAALLAARRLSRSGARVVIATSSDPSDDELERLARSAGIEVVRGPLDDVLARFVRACEELGRDDIVVRATADNPVPDAELVSAIGRLLEESGAGVAGIRWPQSQLPYGVSLEAFRVEALRRAAAEANSAFDREHVTPWLWRHLAGKAFLPASSAGSAGLRCTIDSIDDYHAICRLFSQVPDAVEARWSELVAILARDRDAPKAFVTPGPWTDERHAPFVLGTAQLGLAYGSAVVKRMPAEHEAIRIVRRAVTCGVTHLDTARAYALSEARIGTALANGWAARCKVVTKLDPLDGVPPEAPGWAVEAAVQASVLRSCRELGLKTLPILLLHRSRHRSAWDGAAWRSLLRSRADGLIGRLGVSVSTPEDALGALQDPDVEHLQLPFNLLDQRWDEAEVPAAARRRAGVTVHTRSALLQGVLAEPDAARWPRLAGLDVAALQRWLARTCEATGRKSLADLCLSYVRAQPWVHGIVVGIESLDQLEDTLALFATPLPSAGAIGAINSSRPDVPSALLDPAQWHPAP